MTKKATTQPAAVSDDTGPALLKLRAPDGCCSCPGPDGEPMAIPQSGVVPVSDPALAEILIAQHGFVVVA